MKKIEQDAVLRMAREAGFASKKSENHVLYDALECFAALVRDDEREACAKVCEKLGVHPALNVFNGGPEWYKHGKDCAAAIRSRCSP